MRKSLLFVLVIVALCAAMTIVASPKPMSVTDHLVLPPEPTQVEADYSNGVISDFEIGNRVVSDFDTADSLSILAFDVRGLAEIKSSTTPSNKKDAWPPKLTAKQVKKELAHIDAISADNWAALKASPKGYGAMADLILFDSGATSFGPSDQGSISDVVIPTISEVAANGHKAEAQKRLDDLTAYTAACQEAGVVFPDNIFDGVPWIWQDLRDLQTYVDACK